MRSRQRERLRTGDAKPERGDGGGFICHLVGEGGSIRGFEYTAGGRVGY